MSNISPLKIPTLNRHNEFPNTPTKESACVSSDHQTKYNQSFINMEARLTPYVNQPNFDIVVQPNRKVVPRSNLQYSNEITLHDPETNFGNANWSSRIHPVFPD